MRFPMVTESYGLISNLESEGNLLLALKLHFHGSSPHRYFLGGVGV